MLSPLRGYLYANTSILHDFSQFDKKCSLKGKSTALAMLSWVAPLTRLEPETYRLKLSYSLNTSHKPTTVGGFTQRHIPDFFECLSLGPDIFANHPGELNAGEMAVIGLFNAQ